MAAIVQVESGGNPYAIDDDTTRTSYAPTSKADALLIVDRLISSGHNFDAGIAQINSSNFAQENLSRDTIFDPCLNLQAGSHILSRAYHAAQKTLWLGHRPRTLFEFHAQQQLALYHAFSTYNSGDPQRSLGYADTVVAAAAGSDEILKNYTVIAAPAAVAIAPPATPSPKPKILTFTTHLDLQSDTRALPKIHIDLTQIAKKDGLLK
jgi:type IV secretion system protein VirB1